MSSFVVLLYVFCIAFAQTPPGTPLSPALDPTTNLGILNAERTFWNIPLLQWDTTLVTLAQGAANQCAFNTIDLTTTSTNYASMTRLSPLHADS
jgi:uncharacterized protein YkwD